MRDDGRRYELLGGSLLEGRYGEPTRVEANREFTAERPSPVTLAPATLLA